MFVQLAGPRSYANGWVEMSLFNTRLLHRSDKMFITLLGEHENVQVSNSYLQDPEAAKKRVLAALERLESLRDYRVRSFNLSIGPAVTCTDPQRHGHVMTRLTAWLASRSAKNKEKFLRALMEGSPEQFPKSLGNCRVCIPQLIASAFPNRYSLPRLRLPD